MTFNPHVENMDGITNELKPPQEFLQKFEDLIADMYPQDTIARLRNDNYNPIIIGYTHDPDDIWETMSIKVKLMELSASSSTRKVALEIAPQSLGWIRNFFKDALEYCEHGTIWGKTPTTDQIGKLKSYRNRLYQGGYCSNLALWLLEKGFEVISIEHKKVCEQIDADRKQMSYSEDEVWSGEFGGLSDFQPGYTAIRRDIHGLKVLNKERPDIISVGLYHALKYDFLLKRDGKNSFYFISGNFSWPALLNMWTKVHELYAQKLKA